MGRFFTDQAAGTWGARRAAIGNSLRVAEVQERKSAGRVREHQARLRRQSENRRLAAMAPTFSVADYATLRSRIARLCSPRREATPVPYAALAVLERRLDTGIADPVAILPSAAEARVLAKVLRSHGVDGFFPALERLDEIAGTPRPALHGFNLSLEAFLAALRLVERDKHHAPSSLSHSRFNPPKVTDGTIYSLVSRVKDPARARAARLLRSVVIRRGHPQLFLTPENAVLLADVLRALGADRGLIVSVDQIAGRAP